MAERLKASHLKREEDKTSGGSNPSPSTAIYTNIMTHFLIVPNFKMRWMQFQTQNLGTIFYRLYKAGFSPDD
jgi:hypothetical protein